jgi:hypothetical protein
MHLTEHFSLQEFTKSPTATRMGIANNPGLKEIDALLGLCTNVLEPVREAAGLPLRINSGYRSEKINKAIGGAATSQHCKGEAADIECPGMSNVALAKLVVDLNLDFDQNILEFFTEGDPNSGWVHVSFREGQNRREVLTASRGKGGKTVYSKGLPA